MVKQCSPQVDIAWQRFTVDCNNNKWPDLGLVISIVSCYQVTTSQTHLASSAENASFICSFIN